MSRYHVPQADLRAWVGGTQDGLVALSVEQHVVGCSLCRGDVSRLVSEQAGASVPDLDDVWRALRDDLELPRPSWSERALI